ncbi:DUF4040 domain-containing protein [Microlunatus sp. Gsoil 973]|jgi:uncharacterized MnhB-related membrane protein|uniref:Na(+)/H(+) antiporter subunit B n=1 Tax=Microlunatus sp. Gsoil 973 TaxID=2672569 RepID=UPI0012B47279|nr:DUF4040 domain-containing protein [Microlunatus sp. Gsoil 973]QGN32860.1 DUF4040 domain-containing protein [Microlunatus sp. Gsoil 973]
MIIVIAALLTLVLIGAAVVVFTRRPAQQAVTLGGYGVLLSLLFVAVQAPDVALSQLAVGTAVVPLMVMLAVRKITTLRRSGREDR